MNLKTPERKKACCYHRFKSTIDDSETLKSGISNISLDITHKRHDLKKDLPERIAPLVWEPDDSNSDNIQELLTSLGAAVSDLLE